MDKKDQEILDYLQKKLKEQTLLRSEIASLNAELVSMNEQLRQSEAMKSHFISNITNELVNPFASILGLAENMKKLHDDEGAIARKMGELVYTEAFYLDFQMNNIFEAARIEAGETELSVSTCNIDEVIKSLINSHRFETDKNKLEISYKLKQNEWMNRAFAFRADKERLKLIMINLFSNAIKYSPNNSKIEIILEMEQESMVFTMLDHGNGISLKNLEQIYQRFRKLDESINSLNTGSGLGLSVSKALCELLGGKLELESEEGKGSAFTIRIPELEAQDEDDDVLFSDEELF